MKELAGVILFGVVIWIGWSFISTDYSKPWWNGNEYQKVCSTTGTEDCYELVVSSDGQNITGISMPNGGYITGASSECVKASQLIDARLCRMWTVDGIKWDIMKS